MLENLWEFASQAGKKKPVLQFYSKTDLYLKNCKTLI